MAPLRSLDAGKFAALRALLERSEFTESHLCERLKIANLGELKSPGEGRDPEPLDSACSILTHLFLDREPAAAATLADRLGADAVALLDEFGLLRPDPANPGAYLGTVMLYPVRGLYLVSDRDWEPETGRGTLPREDAVYLAITPNACDFLSALPTSPCEALLDLCSGAGVAALLAARDYAQAACGCDLLDRCASFATWSARLNGIPNFTALTGDLYEPTAGKQFDRIVAHTPYVPSDAQVHAFRDGGPDGERITRGIIRGLPSALRPGGQCHLTAAFAEMAGLSLEDRVRAMLGGDNGAFDLFVAIRRHIPPEAFFQAKDASRDARDRGIERFAYCSIALQRRSVSRPVFTIRRDLAFVPGPMVEWLLHWEAKRREPGFAERLLRERPSAAPGIRLRIEHTLAAKKWNIAAAAISTARPFPATQECPPWVSALLELCDGRATVRDVLETLKARGVVPPQASGADFSRLVQTLISDGFLDLPSLPLP